MTMDFREIKDAVKEAVLDCRMYEKEHYSFPWGWSVAALTKSECRVQWGYFKHMGEEPMTVTVEDNAAEDEEPALCAIAELPCGDRYVTLIGDRPWDECKTIADGVKLAIMGAARRAMELY